MSERKPVLIQAKKACQRVKRKHVTLWKTLSIVLAVVMVLSGVLNVVLGIFDNTVAAFVGGTFWELENEDASAQPQRKPKRFITSRMIRTKTTWTS